MDGLGTMFIMGLDVCLLSFVMNLICVTSLILLQDFFNEAVNFSANIDFSRSQVDESVR